MTPKISFITAVVGAALVLAVPAFGDSWGADQHQATVHVSPDLVDRVDAARQQELSSMLDARERSFAAKSDVTTSSRRIPSATIDSGSIRRASRLPQPRSARLVTSNGCRSGSDLAAASCSPRPLPGNADDSGPPARALIRSQLALGGKVEAVGRRRLDAFCALRAEATPVLHGDERLLGAHHHSPVNSGRRFSTNASTPSRKSCVCRRSP